MYLNLWKRLVDNPIKSTSVNFNSTLTGLSAPCLIEIFGICKGSIGIKLMPLWPAIPILVSRKNDEGTKRKSNVKKKQ